MTFLKPVLGAIIGAGADIGGAVIGANAGENAAKTQLQGTQEALALQKQLYEQQRQDTAPYRTTGYGALSNLQTLLGVTPGHDTPDLLAQSSVSSMPGAVPHQGEPLSNGLPPGWQQASGASPWLMNQLNKLHVNGPAPAATTPSGQAPHSGAATVFMRAPDGSTQAVPQEQVAHYQSLGAQIVNS